MPKDKRLKYVVHHKQYLTEDNYMIDSIAYDESNLELLCIDCHNEEHKTMSTRQGMVFDDMGMLIPRRTNNMNHMNKTNKQ